MKIKTIIPQFTARLAVLSLFIATVTFAAGNARLITGTLTWTITPASGAPVTVAKPRKA